MTVSTARGARRVVGPRSSSSATGRLWSSTPVRTWQSNADGLLDLLQTLRTGTDTAWNDAGDAHAFDLYMTPTATDHLRDTFEYFLDPDWDTDGVSVGSLDVRPFPVEHMRPDYGTVGFVVADGDSAVAYAPDMEGFVGGPPSVEGGVDLFVCEGSPVVGVNHGDEADLLPAIEAVSTDRTVLVNASEHARREHTATLEAHAAEVDCELGSDFDEYAL